MAGDSPVAAEVQSASCDEKAESSKVAGKPRRLPFRVLVIQTDNGAEFQSRFHWHLESHDIRYVYIRPRTPHLNGKVERSHRVDEQEFYQLLDKDGIADDIHLFNDKLREWEDYYNYHRPHGALDGQTPYERLMAKSSASLSTKS
jgi:transposase InsO family protein